MLSVALILHGGEPLLAGRELTAGLVGATIDPRNDPRSAVTSDSCSPDTFGAIAIYLPWRDDPRPAAGLLQGAYAHVGVTEF